MLLGLTYPQVSKKDVEVMLAFVEREQTNRALAAAAEATKKHGILELFRAMDTDGDGTVDESEFFRLEAQKNVAAQLNLSVARLRGIFREKDAKGSGAMNRCYR
eukprot:3154968-Prymnesium_polylepis.1